MPRLHRLDKESIKDTQGVVKERTVFETTHIWKTVPCLIHLVHVSNETPDIGDIGVDCTTERLGRGRLRRRHDRWRRLTSTADHRQETPETHEGRMEARVHDVMALLTPSLPSSSPSSCLASTQRVQRVCAGKRHNTVAVYACLEPPGVHDTRRRGHCPPRGEAAAHHAPSMPWHGCAPVRLRSRACEHPVCVAATGNAGPLPTCSEVSSASSCHRLSRHHPPTRQRVLAGVCASPAAART